MGLKSLNLLTTSVLSDQNKILKSKRSIIII